MEKSLEEKYLDFCVLVCPLEQSRSMSQYFRRSGLFAPTRFLDLDQSVYEFSLFLVSRTTKFSEADVKEYLLWKIWQHKMTHVNEVESDLGKLRVLESKHDFSKEAYKILGKSENLIKRAKELPELPEAQLIDFKQRFEDLINRVVTLTESILLNPVDGQKLIEGK